MRLSSLNRLVLALLSLVFTLGLTSHLSAELVWTPQNGWRVEGGALSGLIGEDGQKAVELMNRAREAEERGNKGSAIKNYNRVARRYPNSVYAPEALYRVAHLRLDRKQYFYAFDAYQQILGRYPNTPRFNELVGEQYRIASALLNGARNRMWGWLPSFTNRSRALEYFEIILINAPYSDYAPLSLMNIARGHQRLHQPEEAMDALDRLINGYPQSLLTPDAYINLAKLHGTLVQGPLYDQAATNQSITYYDDFMLLFPNDANVANAATGLDKMKTVLAESKIKMGDFYYFKRDNYTAARVFYNEAITAYPDSPVAARAKELLVELEAKAAGKDVPGKKKRFWLF